MKTPMISWTRRCLLIGLCVALLSLRLLAQALTGSIEGSVKDEQGAVVAGAEITATQIETNLTRKLTSNEAGFFRLEQLPIGRYRLKAGCAFRGDHAGG